MRLFCLIAVIGAALAPAAAAQEKSGLALLEAPRTHAIMRHALAPGIGDPRGFDVTDCATQRNLDAAGRAQAEETGAAFRAAGVAVDAVWTSQWCRSKDTATLLKIGEPIEVPALNSFFEDRSTRSTQTEALRARLSALSPETTVVMVTHQVNISALLGRSTRSGEVLVFSLGEDGSATVRGSFVIPTP